MREGRMTRRAGGRLLVAVAIAWLLPFAASGALAVLGGGPLSALAGRAADELPDRLLLMRWRLNRPGLAGTELALFDPGRGGFQTLLEGAERPAIAPDGRELYAVQRQEVGDEVRTAVAALETGSFRSRWRAVIDSLPTREVLDRPFEVGYRLAVTRDVVYVARTRWGTTEPATLVALDRVDGFERRRWQVAFESRMVGNTALYPAPDGASLALLAATNVGSPGRMDPRPETVLVRFRLPSGEEEARQALGQSPDQFPLWNARATPDGRVLYALGNSEGGGGVELRLLDLATGVAERLALPIQPSAPDEWLPLQWTVSHDGRLLYMLGPSLDEVAVVDLVARRVVQSALLDVRPQAGRAQPSLLASALAAWRALLAPAALAKPYFEGASLQLSPDGARLYAVGAARDGMNAARPAGVWVVDTRTWRVAERWLPDIQPQKLLLSGDGSLLFVQQASGPLGSQGSPLRVVEASTGAERVVAAPVEGTLYSLAELYRETYGRSLAPAPAPAPAAPAPVADLVLRVAPDVAVPGDPVTVEARFVDPATGATVRPGQTDVRYDPPAQVAALLGWGRVDSHGLAVALAPAEYGVFQGRTQAPQPEEWAPGSWAAQVVATWPDGLKRRAVLPDALVVEPAFAGADGRRYRVVLSAEPTPVADMPSPVRLALVDAETGAPLPDSVGLRDGLPDSVEAAFFAPMRGVTVQRLQPAGHGVYAGQVVLWAPGPWRVRVGFRPGSGPAVSFVAGVVQVTGRDPP